MSFILFPDKCRVAMALAECWHPPPLLRHSHLVNMQNGRVALEDSAEKTNNTIEKPQGSGKGKKNKARR